jgi:hypothetical protein
MRTVAGRRPINTEHTDVEEAPVQEVRTDQTAMLFPETDFGWIERQSRPRRRRYQRKAA